MCFRLQSSDCGLRVSTAIGSERRFLTPLTDGDSLATARGTDSDCGFAPSPSLQVGFINSTASQSSNSRCDGASLCMPKSSGVATNPAPKYCCQTRLTIERAVVGELRSTSHFAKASRSGAAPAGKGCRNAGTPGV